jgi:hypothetical protein
MTPVIRPSAIGCPASVIPIVLANSAGPVSTRTAATRGRFMSDERGSLRISFVLGAFGFVNVLTLVGKPSLASIRAVDVIHLIGTGLCLGGALVALVLYLLGRRPG